MDASALVPFKATACAYIAVLVLLLLSSLMSRSPDVHVTVKDLVQQSAQLAEVCAQDHDKAIALQHSTQALTLLSVARKLASDGSIQKETGVNIQELERVLLDLQAEAIGKLGGREPTLLNVVAGYASL